MGGITSIGGKTVNGAAVWNGVSWSALGSGLSSFSLVTGIREESGKIYICGSFTSAGGLSDVGGFAIWNGSTWERDNIRSSSIYAFPRGMQRDIYQGNLYILMSGVPGDVLYTPSLVTVTNRGDTITYPIIRFPMGSMYSIANTTTGNRVMFEGLTVVYGEVVTLRCTDSSMELLSNVRGNISRYIMPGSDILTLLPGDNVFSVYGGSDIGPEKSYIQFKDCYADINTVVVV